jgi:SOS-response transcriptional repressor LexA/DNA-binding transcriptional regulator YiaG
LIDAKVNVGSMHARDGNMTSRTFKAESSKPSWATAIQDLREHSQLDQTAFGQKVHASAMGVSRWERGVQEPPSHSYIELGNLAGDPDCWYFWGRAGLRNEDLMRVMPDLEKRLRVARSVDVEIVRAGSGGKKTREKLQLVAIPLLKVKAASLGKKGDASPVLHAAAVESMIAAPKGWCPNPEHTVCLRVSGDSMLPLIHDGNVIAVDATQTDHTHLDGKIVVAWNKDNGLTVSRFRHYDHTEVLQPDNQEYESVTLNNKNHWKILAKVLWWVAQAP